MANNNIPVKIEFGGIDKVTPILGSINLRIGGLSKQFESLNKLTKFTAITTGLSEIRNLLGGISSQFTASFGSTIDSFSNIEDNFNRLGILLERKPSDVFLGGLKNKWKELSEVSTMSASEISNVSKDVVNSGVRDEAFISGFTKQAVLLADASKREMNAEDAFKMLSEFKNAFNLKATDLPKLTDQIAFARDHGQANFQEYHEGFKYAAPTWGALTNSSPAQYLAFMSELSNHGIAGSTAGTALRRLPTQLVEQLTKSTMMKLSKNADSDMQKTLEDFKSNTHNSVLHLLGLNFKDINDKKDQQRIDLIKAIHKIKEKLPKISADKQISVVKNLFGQEALSTGLTAVRFMDVISQILDDIVNKSQGKAQQQADSTRNTLRSEITKTEHAWENFKISILDSSTGEHLKKINEVMKEIGLKIQGLSPDMKTFIGDIGIAGYAASQFGTFLSPIVMSMFFLAQTMSIIKNLGVFTFIKKEAELLLFSIQSLIKWQSAYTIAANTSTGIFTFIKNEVGLLIFAIKSLIKWQVIYEFITTNSMIIYTFNQIKKVISEIIVFTKSLVAWQAIYEAVTGSTIAIYMFGMIRKAILEVRTAMIALNSVTAIFDILMAANPLGIILIGISISLIGIISMFDDLKKSILDVANTAKEKFPVLGAITDALGITDFKDKDVKISTDGEMPKNNFSDLKSTLNMFQNMPDILKNEDIEKLQKKLEIKDNSDLKKEIDLNVKFENAPQGTKVIQKTKNTPPANLSLGYAGAAHL